MRVWCKWLSGRFWRRDMRLCCPLPKSSFNSMKHLNFLALFIDSQLRWQGPRSPLEPQSNIYVWEQDIGQALHACSFFFAPMFSTPDIFEMRDVGVGSRPSRSRYTHYGTSYIPAVRAEQSRVELSGGNLSHTHRPALMKWLDWSSERFQDSSFVNWQIVCGYIYRLVFLVDKIEWHGMGPHSPLSME